MAWPIEHVVDNLRTRVSAIKLLDDPFVNRFALTAQAAGQLESGPLSLRHDEELLNNRLHQLNGTHASFNVIIVVMPVLLDTVKCIFVLVLPMSNKPRIF